MNAIMMPVRPATACVSIKGALSAATMTSPIPIVVPYPAATQARGWRLDLHCERVVQSDTWALAPSESRPWLLMLWMTAWMQTPCGTLPNDARLIAARLGMPYTQFQQYQDVLLRGWQVAEDGLLYHTVLTTLVLQMCERRDKDSARKAQYRAT